MEMISWGRPKLPPPPKLVWIDGSLYYRSFQVTARRGGGRNWCRQTDAQTQLGFTSAIKIRPPRLQPPPERRTGRPSSGWGTMSPPSVFMTPRSQGLSRGPTSSGQKSCGLDQPNSGEFTEVDERGPGSGKKCCGLTHTQQSGCPPSRKGPARYSGSPFAVVWARPFSGAMHLEPASLETPFLLHPQTGEKINFIQMSGICCLRFIKGTHRYKKKLSYS